jgi:hypothetical protein
MESCTIALWFLFKNVDVLSESSFARGASERNAFSSSSSTSSILSNGASTVEVFVLPNGPFYASYGSSQVVYEEDMQHSWGLALL